MRPHWSVPRSKIGTANDDSVDENVGGAAKMHGKEGKSMKMDSTQAISVSGSGLKAMRVPMRMTKAEWIITKVSGSQ
jgi:hypothetical protein